MFYGKKVLIVEDSPTIRQQVKMILEKVGITVVQAANELGMFNVIEEYGKCVDLIIMDVTLKYENGFDLIRKIKYSDKYKNIPVLVLSEHAGKEHILEAKELGVSGYLKKPLIKDELLNRLDTVLSTNNSKNMR